MRLYLSLLLISVLLFGCGSGKHCIKIGGNYQGAEGEIEYCFDVEKSEEVGRPVLRDAAGQKFFALTKADVKKLNTLLETKKKKKGKAKSINPPPQKNIERLLRHLK